MAKAPKTSLSGLSDAPIMSRGEDTLNMRAYAEALADFTRTCKTPMTISIQGDWGSGKSSIMHMIQSEITSDPGKKGGAKAIWFDTWQFAQFGSGDVLPITLLSTFIRKLQEGKKGSNDTPLGECRLMSDPQTMDVVLKLMPMAERLEYVRSLAASESDIEEFSQGYPEIAAYVQAYNDSITGWFLEEDNIFHNQPELLSNYIQERLGIAAPASPPRPDIQNFDAVGGDPSLLAEAYALGFHYDVRFKAADDTAPSTLDRPSLQIDFSTMS